MLQSRPNQAQWQNANAVGHQNNSYSNPPRIIKLEDGWNFIHSNGIEKIQKIIENDLNEGMSTEIVSQLYT